MSQIANAHHVLYSSAWYEIGPESFLVPMVQLAMIHQHHSWGILQPESKEQAELEKLFTE